MGLGLHGGGLATARWFAEHGAYVTVTDLKAPELLEASLKKLEDLPRERLHFTLGRHEENDFLQADMVIKNPAVPKGSPYLKLAKRVESDISMFLTLNRRPLIAVTGSKGKSTVVSALYHTIKALYPGAMLGGNITVNPLLFADAASEPGEDPVILELSSWQLGDLADPGLLKPRLAIITNIMHDHQNSYPSMEAYVDDKARIYAGQGREDLAILNGEDPWYGKFRREAPGRVLTFFSSPPPAMGGQHDAAAWLNDRGEGWLRHEGGEEQILPADILLPGEHNRLNLLVAAAALRSFGLSTDVILDGMARFPGVAHRLELVRERQGVRWYNDSTATIPEACAGAVKSFPGDIILICGGTDKKLDFTELEKVIARPKRIILLQGSATDRLLPLLKEKEISFDGPYPALLEAVQKADEAAARGDVVLFSPGATSFGMFVNEFDRGNQFRAMVTALDEQ